MRVDVTPEALEVAPGVTTALAVSIFNDAPVIVAYRIRVLGVDPSWTSIDEPEMSLFPDSAGSATILLEVPREAPAGTRRIGIEVTSLTEPTITEIVEVDTVTVEEPIGRVQLEPVSVFAAKTGTFGVTLHNEGNAPLDLELAAEDDEDHLDFEFTPRFTRLAPGERGYIQLTARGRRPFLGAPVAHPFRVHAREQPMVPPAVGTLVQRAWISRGAMSLMGLLLAASVFALVLTTSLGRVVDQSRANEDLLLNVVRGETDDPSITNPADVGGTVTLLTSGAPVSGVTVDLFAADDPNLPRASSATDEAGSYSFGGLAEDTYKVRFRGAGFTEVWYEEGFSFDEATDVDVGEGESVDGIDVRLGGVPGSISGQILGEDPGGAVITLEVPADVIDGDVDAVVMSSVVDATGEFMLDDVPAPSSYVLRVDKEGFAPAVRLVNIGAGEAVENVELRLRVGDGTISGTVVDDSGPLGGATIVATSGDTEIRTSSLTRDGVGSFTLRDLPTPGTYTIQVSADGYIPETFSVNLSSAEQVSGTQVRLRGGAGSISGRVGVVGEGPLGGVQITVSDGDRVFTSESLSVGDVGSYQVDGLPVPGSYTVSFSRAGFSTQIRSVELDEFGNSRRTGIDANLTRATGVLRGTVIDEGGTALGGVQITATSGDDTRVIFSAHDPPGRYELRNLPAGTYTVTFERPGSQARAVLVSLSAGETEIVDMILSPQASISGTVTVSGTPTGGLPVRLFRVETYPSTILTTVITDGAGRYTFPALDAPQTYVVEYLDAGGTVVGTRTITLLAGEQRAGVDFNVP